MKRPTSVRVMGKKIAVHFVPAGDKLLRDSPEDDDPGLGRSCELTQVIAVENSQPLGQEQDCVLHEVLHHVEYSMKMDVPEEIVEKFATGLLAVLKDNPSLVAYLRAREK